jgi:hypothetical protein
MTKLIVTKISPSLNINSETVECVQKVLADLAAKYGKDATVDFSNNYYGDTEFTLRYEAEETDIEYNTRLQREKLVTRQAREQRRQQYLSLKEEFGNE